MKGTVAIMLNNLFNPNTTGTTGGGANQLMMTGQLTNTATAIVAEIMKAIEADEQKYAPMVIASQTSHDKMDELIAAAFDLTTVDVEFLKGLSADDVEKMLRSQQSKRSRSKSKSMTLDTYKSMMVGAISENLLRISANKPKSAGGGGAPAGDIGYTEDKIAEYAADQEKLKKEIRNVQSKKSIMKAKVGFSDTDARWLQLLEAEEILKKLKTGEVTTTIVTIADERVDKLQEILTPDVDISKLSNKDAKAMLEKMRATITIKTEEVPANDNQTPANEAQRDSQSA